jgi:DNA polymerase-3 subunit epsilon
LKNLELKRPLAFFDLETTGIDPATDKIVEICVVRAEPGGGMETKTRRINPERPIPPAATAIHGIRDEDVRDEPTFRQIARGLLDFLNGADLAGFNVRRFDAPLLDREFSDCGLDFRLAERRIVDAMTIFHRMEPRDLSAASRFYLERELVGAHGAEADVLATVEILDAQLTRYANLPRSVDELDLWGRGGGPGGVDLSGKFVWKDGEAVFRFGKHQGLPLRRVVREAPDYLEWILQSDFPPDTKALVRAALDGTFPTPPSAEEDQST